MINSGSLLNYSGNWAPYITRLKKAAAESRYEIIEKLAPDHPDIEEVFPYLVRARLEAAKKRLEEEERTRIV